MAGVTKVPGASGSSDSSNNDRVNATPKKNFGDLMKIGKTDPEQKKKKKQKAEDEETKKTDAILAQGQKIHKHTPGELASFEKKAQKVEKAGESEKRQPKQGKRTEEEIAEEASSVVTPVKTEKTFDSSSKDIKKETAGVFKKEKPPEDIPVEEPQPLDESDVKFDQKMAAIKSTKKSEPKKQETPIPTPQPIPLNTPNLLSPASAIAPAYASLKPEAFALFERLLGTMSVMHTSGISETTIELNSSEFSTFAGAKIVITEHSTAPKVFNIEFLGNAQTIALFSDNSANLMAAFKNGNYAFKVNRIDASLIEAERPLFHRKEKAGDKEDEGEKP